MAAAVERGLSGIRTIKAAVAEDREGGADRHGRRWAPTVRGVAAAKLQAVVDRSCRSASRAFIVVLTVGGVRVADGSLALGDLLAFILYLFLLVLPIGSALGPSFRSRRAWRPSTGSRRSPGWSPKPATRTASRPDAPQPRRRRSGSMGCPSGTTTAANAVLADLSFSVPAGQPDRDRRTLGRRKVDGARAPRALLRAHRGNHHL
jgi:ABC-type multidrug transport system fused ATPase/permease subunit